MKMVSFEKLFVNSPIHARRTINSVEKLLHFVQLEGKRNCLEIGCGSGATSKYIAEKYLLEVTGVDIDPEEIKLARKKTVNLPPVHFSQADATSLPFPDSCFDIVLCYKVLHHVPDWSKAFNEISRVLKPGGYFMYVDFVVPHWTLRFWSSRLMTVLLTRNYGILTVAGVRSFLEQHDFSTLHSSVSKKYVLICNEYEAVYQRQG